ncbi:hypothetical protein SAMN05421874_10662 [Nonomuraea maritima]|uniref:Uncharacterized protein n=1 Tax=Nonomuraea maritima TaxID=683260 RepID=A0A1G9A6N4_9ACTN|nr:hypothetical protein [Nonomuraea maritima]SDK22957.1 hypothetical protein SAMN05421874_10662 [Nonomuraea maritima]
MAGFIGRDRELATLGRYFAISRSGCEADGVTHIGPEQLLDAWR